MGRKKNFSREDVLAKTIPLFWKNGFAETSMQDIEKATGVNKSGIYSEFADKEDVYVSSLQHYVANNQSLTLLNRDPLGWKNVEDFLLSSLDCRGPKGCFVASSVREINVMPPRAKTCILTQIKAVKTFLLANLKADGLGPRAEPMAAIILTFNSGLCLQSNLKLPEEETRANIRALLALLRAE